MAVTLIGSSYKGKAAPSGQVYVNKDGTVLLRSSSNWNPEASAPKTTTTPKSTTQAPVKAPTSTPTVIAPKTATPTSTASVKVIGTTYNGQKAPAGQTYVNKNGTILLRPIDNPTSEQGTTSNPKPTTPTATPAATPTKTTSVTVIGDVYNGKKAPEGQTYVNKEGTILLRPKDTPTATGETTQKTTGGSADIKGVFKSVFGRDASATELTYWQGRTDKTGSALVGAMQFAKNSGKSVGEIKSDSTADPIAGFDSDLNSSQAADFARVSAETTTVDKSKSAELVDKLTAIINEKPETTSLVDTYNNELLKSGYNEDAASLTEAERAIKQLDADFATQLQTEEGRQVSMTQVRRRQSAEQTAYDATRRDLVVERDYLANKVANKQAVVNTMVTLMGKDIDNAQTEYQSKVQNAISITNLIRGIEQDQLTAQERAQDNARANVQVMSNLLASGNVKYTQLDTATKSQLKSMELQAGLPAGFTQFVSETIKDPDVQFLPAFTDVNGVRIQPVVTVNKETGAYTIKNISQGKVDQPSTETKLSDAQKEGQKFLEDVGKLQEKMIAEDYTWQQAWDVLRSRYPSASVETIDNALGLSFRSKYNK